MYESFDDLDGLGAFPTLDDLKADAAEFAVKSGSAILAMGAAKFAHGYLNEYAAKIPAVGQYADWATPAVPVLLGLSAASYARRNATSPMALQAAEGAALGFIAYGLAAFVQKAVTAFAPAGTWGKIAPYNAVSTLAPAGGVSGLGAWTGMDVRSYLNAAPMRSELAAAPTRVEAFHGAPTRVEPASGPVNGFSALASTLC